VGIDIPRWVDSLLGRWISSAVPRAACVRVFGSLSLRKRLLWARHHARSCIEGANHETNLPAEQNPPEASARFPRAHAHEGRPACTQAAACEGPQAAGSYDRFEVSDGRAARAVPESLPPATFPGVPTCGAPRATDDNRALHRAASTLRPQEIDRFAATRSHSEQAGRQCSGVKPGKTWDPGVVPAESNVPRRTGRSRGDCPSRCR
jgi:hypothetical protein